MAKRRVELARLREARGYSQGTLAEKVGVDQSTIARWELGLTTPQPGLRPLLAEALEITMDVLNGLLGLPLAPVPRRSDAAQAPDPARSVVTERTWPYWDPDDHADVVDPSWEFIDARYVLHLTAGGIMDRREFLTIASTTITGLGSQWSTAVDTVSLPGSSATVPGTRLTNEGLDRLDARLAQLSRLDDTFGGRDYCQLAAAEYRNAVRLIDNAAFDNSTGKRLFSTITRTARLAGWLHFDANYHTAAQNYYIAALRASVFTNSPIDGAHVLRFMSLQAAETGRIKEAITLAEIAEDKTRNIATPRLKSWLAVNKAYVHAQAGDRKACAVALNQAERWLDKAQPGTEEPDWVYYHDENNISGWAARCWVLLDDPRQARPLLDSYLQDRNPRYIRDGALRLVHSAEAHLQAHDLHPACADLHAAADLARNTGSTRVINLIHTTRRTMSPHNNQRHVKDLDRHLATLRT